jgi:NADPH2:quinone reductase
VTDGRGVDVAYDGIGGGTLLKTFASVRRFGTVASIGQAGGAIPSLDINEIGPARSLSLARPSIMAYSSERDTYLRAAAEVIGLLSTGLVPATGRSYPLREAARAHSDLESGRTTGALSLVPEGA